MAKLSELLEKEDGLKKYASTVATAEKIIGTASGVYGYYQSAKAIGEALGLWDSGPSEFELLAQAIADLQNAIRKSFEALNLQLKSEFDGLTKKLLEEPLAVLKGAVTTLDQHWDEPAEMDIPALLQDTVSAMYQITGGSYWKRTFYKEAAYQDPWTGPDVPPDLEAPNGELPEAGAEHWDYLLALPVFLGGLSCRVIVLRMLDAEDIPTDYRGELLGYADTLRETYEKIVAGIHTLRQPTHEEVMFQKERFASSVAPLASYTLSQSRWEQSGPLGGLYGAYDVRSTVASVEGYPTQPPRPWFGTYDALYGTWHFVDKGELTALRDAVAAWYDEEIERLHGLRSLRHWKRVYSSLSLRLIWRVRNELLMLIGLPSEASPGPTDLWSLREAVDAIPAEIRPDYRLRAITDFCKTAYSLTALQGV